MVQGGSKRVFMRPLPFRGGNSLAQEGHGWVHAQAMTSGPASNPTHMHVEPCGFGRGLKVVMVTGDLLYVDHRPYDSCSIELPDAVGGRWFSVDVPRCVVSHMRDV